jgi:predicted transcriptional regulator
MMPEINAVGDVILTDVRAMRVLADAPRLALHDLLRRRGPARLDELAPLLQAEPGAIAEDLKALEDVELVERLGEEERWAAVGRASLSRSPRIPTGSVRQGG